MQVPSLRRSRVRAYLAWDVGFTLRETAKNLLEVVNAECGRCLLPSAFCLNQRLSRRPNSHGRYPFRHLKPS